MPIPPVLYSSTPEPYNRTKISKMYDFCRFALQPYQRRACGARVVGDELHGIHPVFQRGEVDDAGLIVGLCLVKNVLET